MERVVITGIGLVTPIGIGTDETWRALLAGESGIAPITLFDATAFRVRFAGEVKSWDADALHREEEAQGDGPLHRVRARRGGRWRIKDAKLELTDEERDDAGCFIGVGSAASFTLEKTKQTLIEKGPTKVSPYSSPASSRTSPPGQVSMAHGLRGPSYCNTSACSSGAHALGEAAEWIRRGKAQVMVAGGAEATVTPVGIGGFEAMFALSRATTSPTQASRPWDKGRDGFVCGEGAGILVLESLDAREEARREDLRRDHRLRRVERRLPPHEAGARRRGRAARDADGAQGRAASRPTQIDYVNAHGTSTPVGDIEETRGDRRRSSASTRLDKKLWVSSTKSMMGHLLGAAGAVESGALRARDRARARSRRRSTSTIPDPAVPARLRAANTARERRVTHALNNSFGFGGTNCSLVFSRFEG